jgi:diaminohydroxyphosphoribosylaminopyrimidine deaminase/5-amino-6-(5-phosphoribosylamino)uracil reductase
VAPPLRVVVDSLCRTPCDSDLIATPGPVLIAATDAAPAVRRNALIAAGAEVLGLPAVDGRVSLPALLALLARREENEILAECGPTLAGALVARGLVDEIVLYVAPVMMGHEARELLRLPGLERMTDAQRWRFCGARFVGEDLRIVLRPRHDED